MEISRWILLDKDLFLYSVSLLERWCPNTVHYPCGSSVAQSLLPDCKNDKFPSKEAHTVGAASDAGPPENFTLGGPETVNIYNPCKPCPTLGPLNHHNHIAPHQAGRSTAEQQTYSQMWYFLWKYKIHAYICDLEEKKESWQDGQNMAQIRSCLPARLKFVKIS